MPLTRAERVQRRRAKLRAAGLRPVQLWVTDTRAPRFAEEAARQSRLIAEADRRVEGHAETEFWERLAADAWNDLD